MRKVRKLQKEPARSGSTDDDSHRKLSAVPRPKHARYASRASTSASRNFECRFGATLILWPEVGLVLISQGQDMRTELRFIEDVFWERRRPAGVVFEPPERVEADENMCARGGWVKQKVKETAPRLALQECSVPDSGPFQPVDTELARRRKSETPV